MQMALNLIRSTSPNFEIEGEMHIDAALDESVRQNVFPNSQLKGEANLVIMPTLDAANIAFNMTRSLAEGQSIGPVLMGLKKSAHIITSSTTVRGIYNMTGFAVVDALRHQSRYLK